MTGPLQALAGPAKRAKTPVRTVYNMGLVPVKANRAPYKER